jgi:hypothetical protein
MCSAMIRKFHEAKLNDNAVVLGVLEYAQCLNFFVDDMAEAVVLL